MNITFEHDQILFEGLPLNKLTPTQKGILADFINDLPSVDELSDLEETSRKYENLQADLNRELKFLASDYGKKDLLNNTTQDFYDYYKDFVTTLMD